MIYDFCDWLNKHLTIEECVLASGILVKKFDPELRLSDPKFGDFQANGAFSHAKRLKISPKLLAEEILNYICQKFPEIGRSEDSMIWAEIAGPGFINFRLHKNFLLNWLVYYKNSETMSESAKNILSGQQIVIDYSCPNTAKQMHVGHLRSMVIGDSLQRILRFHGAKVIRDNHIGDWGTQFGILIAMIKRKNFVFEEHSDDILEDLENLYRDGNSWVKEDLNNLNQAREELVKLQKGDKENEIIWQKINKLSYDSFDDIYKQMNVSFDVVLGESFYRDKIDRVCEELQETSVARFDQGALVVFFDKFIESEDEREDDYSRFKNQPLIVLKSDGASNYATTDLATVLYRLEKWNVDNIIYVTDGRQSDHFNQVFLTVKQWFKRKNYRVPKMTHTPFGMVLGSDGKAIKTRTGGSVKLKDLMQEAIARASVLVQEKSQNLSKEKQENIARVIGLSAIKYADLSQNRTSDYVFAWDKLLSFEGNTAPYLLYAVARIHAIFRKSGQNLNDFESDIECNPLDTKSEFDLARKLILFPIILNSAVQELKPHLIATYLFELASEFSTFYNAEKVLVDDLSDRNKRLLLCARTLTILQTGLSLLGIETLEEM